MNFWQAQAYSLWESAQRLAAVNIRDRQPVSLPTEAEAVWGTMARSYGYEPTYHRLDDFRLVRDA